MSSHVLSKNFSSKSCGTFRSQVLLYITEIRYPDSFLLKILFQLCNTLSFDIDVRLLLPSIYSSSHSVNACIIFNLSPFTVKFAPFLVLADKVFPSYSMPRYLSGLSHFPSLFTQLDFAVFSNIPPFGSSWTSKSTSSKKIGSSAYDTDGL